MGILSLLIIALTTISSQVAEGFNVNSKEIVQSQANSFESFISDRGAGSNRCKSKRSCAKKGGKCVVDGTCQTIEIEAECGYKDGDQCKCCAKAIEKRCKASSECIDDGGFCIMNKKACAKGTLRKGQCRCRSKKGRRQKGHCCIPQATSPGWGYKNDSQGPDNWHKNYPNCTGNNQSPVDLLERGWDSFTQLNYLDDPWNFSGYDEPITPNIITVKNNGHFVTVAWDEAIPASVMGGHLGAEYILHELQIHWGINTTEHYIPGNNGYDVELHFVHYKSEYGNMDTAMEHSDGLAILAMTYLVFDYCNQDTACGVHHSLMPITDVLSNIVEPGTEIRTTFPYALFNLIGARNEPGYRDYFYRYKGSLTSPPCNEVVTWTVFVDDVSLSIDQFNAFRSLKFEDGSPMLYNNRPMQPLNSREVYRT